MNSALAKLAGRVDDLQPEKVWRLGSAVVDGTIQFFSVSQLQTLAGCERQWWWDKVKHLKRKELEAQKVGVRAHKQWAHYLKTGEDVLGDIARIAKPKLPPPGADLLVEQQFCPTDVPGGQQQSQVFAAGIPLVGDIDLVNPRRMPDVIRLTDHKTSSKPAQYAATEQSLKTINLEAIRADEDGAPGAGIQMLGYGLWALAQPQFVAPSVIELEHIITPTKAPKKAKPESLVVLASTTPAEVRAEWAAKVDPLAERAKAIAQMSEPPEPNWSVCEKYGGCSFKAQCLTHQARSNKPMSVLAMLKKTNTPAAVVTPPPAAAAPEQAKAQESKPFGTVKVADCVEGKEYVIDGVSGLVGTFDGTSKTFGFFTTKEGMKKYATITMVEPVPEAPKPAEVVKYEAPKPEPVVVYDAGQAPATPVTTAPTVTVTVTETPAAEAKKPRAVKAKETELRVYVDAVPNGPAEPLAAYAAGLAKQMETTFNVVDIRCAPKKGEAEILAFGGWKGVLASMVKAEPPKPGTYVALGTAGSEIMQVVADALEGICAPGNFVRGVR